MSSRDTFVIFDKDGDEPLATDIVKSDMSKIFSYYGKAVPQRIA